MSALRRTAPTIIIAIAAGAISVAFGQDASRPPHAQGASYDVVLLDGSPYIDIVAGGATGTFLFDTGANTSGIDSSWLARSGARATIDGATTVGGTTGVLTMPTATIDRLDLGHGFFLGAKLGVQDFSHFAQPVGKTQAGLLGTDFINCYAATLDFERKKLTLALRAERAPPGADFADVAVDYPLGLPCRLDSGASYRDPGVRLDVNAATIDALRARGVALEPAGQITVAGVAGGETLALLRARGAALEIGPWSRSDVVLVVHDRGTLAVGSPLGLASASVIGRLGVFTLDPFDRKLWVKRPGTRGAGVVGRVRDGR